MKEHEVLKLVNQIYQAIFNKDNNLSLDLLLEKYAFDIKLPKEVRDSTTNEITWADSINSNKFITLTNMEEKDKREGWMLPKENISSLEDIIRIWNKTNYITTERVFDSLNVSKSDTIYRCQNVYHSTDCFDCKNIIFCDSCNNCEYSIASQRSGNCTYCIKVDDSKDCSNSFNVNYSNKVSNSLFIQDCYNLYECMFCSHIANKRYCIANMQFTEEEYFHIKEYINNWILK